MRLLCDCDRGVQMHNELLIPIPERRTVYFDRLGDLAEGAPTARTTVRLL